LISPGLTYNPTLQDFDGLGNFIEFDISNISSTLSAGNYINPVGFWSGIGLNYSSTTQGNQDEINTNLPGSLNISKSGATYVISFEYTLLSSGQKVTGQYTGSAEKGKF
jgi:hypothetical protein